MPTTSYLVRAAAAALLPVLALTGCGAGEEKKKDGGKSATPKGPSITKAGADLDFGEKAVVKWTPNATRSTTLELTVDKVTQGVISDLSMYTLDEKARKAVPYYVAVTVKNVGDGDVGRLPVPLFGVDDDNTLVQSSGFTNTFRRCPSQPLPQSFAPQDTARVCLVYLVPDGRELTGVSYRPEQKYAPIEWTGDIKVNKPPAEKKPR